MRILKFICLLRTSEKYAVRIVVLITRWNHRMTKKTLVIGPSWVGDMVMAQSLFRLIKDNQAGVELHVMAPKHCKSLLDAMPEVDKSIEMPFAHGQFVFAKRKALGRSMRASGYTNSIVLPNSWKSALIPYFAKIPCRTGYKGESRYLLLNDCRKLDKTKFPLMIQRFCALGVDSKVSLSHSLPKPKLVLPADWVADTTGHFDIQRDQSVLVLCPGAEFGPAKQWPAKHYAQVASHYIQQGWQVWLLGAKGDQAVTDAISALEPMVNNFAGKTSLQDAMVLIQLADKVLTNDSGLMHIAAGLDRPLVAVYGSSSPLFTPPLNAKAQILAIELNCRPCFKRQCPKKGDLHLKCLNDLQPSSIIQALDQL